MDQENADHFLIKVKEKDEFVFKEILKLLFNFKKGDVTQEKLISRFEEMLLKFPDLLEEAYLFLDYKRVRFFCFKLFYIFHFLDFQRYLQKEFND